MLSPEQDVLYELATLSGNINSINLGHRTLGFPVARTVKNLAAMKEARVRSLGWEDPWTKAWQLTPVFLPGESHEREAWQATVHRVTKTRT